MFIKWQIKNKSCVSTFQLLLSNCSDDRVILYIFSILKPYNWIWKVFEDFYGTLIGRLHKIVKTILSAFIMYYLCSVQTVPISLNFKMLNKDFKCLNFKLTLLLYSNCIWNKCILAMRVKISMISTFILIWPSYWLL